MIMAKDSRCIKTNVCVPLYSAKGIDDVALKEEFGLEWQDCQQTVTDEFLCIVTGCVLGNRCMSLDV